MTEIKANKDAALVAEVGMPHGSHGHGEGHEYPYTAHHFESAEQQFDSGKLGIWLFLVTEILFFAGLFCAYTVYRGQHPEVFYWAHFYLDTQMGALNTIVLIFSSFTAAWAVRNAQLGQQKLLKINILLTIACACIFMCVKYVEYSHKFHDGLLPTRHFDPKEEVWELESFKHKHPASAAAMEHLLEEQRARLERRASAARATEVAPTALVPAQQTAPVAAPAPEVKGTKAAVGAAAAEAAAAPATATAAATSEGSAEPAPAVGATEPAAAPTAAAPTTEVPEAPAAAPAAATTKPTEELADDVWLAHAINSLTPEEAEPLYKAGVIHATQSGHPLSIGRPEKAGVFFSIYFFMTGLHGVHVVIGIGIWIWMLVRANRRRFGPEYFGPIDFTALYWHLVDLVWIYLFPLLYLIH